MALFSKNILVITLQIEAVFRPIVLIFLFLRNKCNKKSEVSGLQIDTIIENN